MEFQFPPEVELVFHKLHTNGFEAYFVGGCVRDQLLGRNVYDYDITTSAKPAEVKALFEKTVDTGIENGTVTVISGKFPVEVTTYRVDGSYADCRHPGGVTFVSSLKDDVLRRDFTINALCVQPGGEVIDFTGGLADIENKTLRAIGNPETRFSEDALRMLRAVRFCSTLEFSLEKETLCAIEKLATLISNVSKERIWAEFEKILLGAHPEALCLVSEVGLMRGICEQLDAICAKIAGTVPDISSFPPSLPLRFAVYFRGEPADKIQEILKSLRCSNAVVRGVVQDASLLGAMLPKDRLALKRMLYQFGIPAALEAAKARVLLGEPDWANVAEEIKDIEQTGDCLTLSDLQISGIDLIPLGFGGVEIGRELNRLLEHVWMHPEDNELEKLLQTAKYDK